MTVAKYSLPALRAHTDAVRQSAEALVSSAEPSIEDAFAQFSEFLALLQEEDKSLQRNVRQILSCRFFNHVYAGLLLVEAGLVADAVVCQRSALETLAADRLLCLEPDRAEEYSNERFPRPVEVRKALEAAGYAHEAEQIRSLYSGASGVTHVTRDSERFHVQWHTESEGALHFGGRYDARDIEKMTCFFAALLHWFPQPLSR